MKFSFIIIFTLFNLLVALINADAAAQEENDSPLPFNNFTRPATPHPGKTLKYLTDAGEMKSLKRQPRLIKKAPSLPPLTPKALTR